MPSAPRHPGAQPRSAPRPPRRSAPALPAPLRSSPGRLPPQGEPPARLPGPPGPASRSRPPAGSPGDSSRLPPQEAPQPPRRLPLGARLWQVRLAASLPAPPGAAPHALPAGRRDGARGVPPGRRVGREARAGFRRRAGRGSGPRSAAGAGPGRPRTAGMERRPAGAAPPAAPTARPGLPPRRGGPGVPPPGECRTLPSQTCRGSHPGPGLPAPARTGLQLHSAAECPPTLRFARRIYWLHGKKIGSRKGYVVFAASAEFIPPLGTAQTSQEGPGCSVGNSGAFPARRVWER